MEADPFVAPEHPAPAPELRRRAAESGIPHPAELVTGDTGNTPALPATPGSDGRSLQRVSEAAAEITLNSFLQVRASRYSGGMSSMNLAPYACSRLSVHLAWGTISMRQAYHALSRRLADANLPPAFRKGLRSFRSRLFWHDHFIQRLEDEPEMEFHPLNRAFEDAPFKPNGTLLEAWYRGRTGFPFVDAGMRCLAATGYLNFRMRAMLMSAATHGLGLPWQDVLYPMARLMADYLPGIHISQSQMQAGVVGINTIRIYNPQKQLKDHDPECRFTKKWLPELRGLPPEKIAAEEIPRGDAETAYPEPVVNYREQVAAMRRALWSIKGSPEGRAEAERVLEKHGSRKGGGARRRRS
jgi:deoxyribodipyrimidine photo-lyase